MIKIMVVKEQGQIIKQLNKNNIKVKRDNLCNLKIEAEKVITTDGRSLFILSDCGLNGAADGVYRIYDVIKEGTGFFIVVLDKVEEQFPDYTRVIPEENTARQITKLEAGEDLSLAIWNIKHNTGVLLAAAYVELCQAAGLVIMASTKEDNVLVKADTKDPNITGVILGLKHETK